VARRESVADRRARHAEVDDPQLVLDAAARFLEVRPRSIAEVRRRLKQAGYRDELIERSIERLTELGVLDDAAFARAWVESRDRAHPRGEHALMIELRQKGVDAPTIAATLVERREAAVRWEDRSLDDPGPGEAGASPLEEEAARRLLHRHARALERVADPRARRQRAYALLARNGFDPETAGSVSRQFVEAAAATVQPDDEPPA
jgi:regulatory protein